MILTYDEAQNVRGRFFEYEYETTVVRTPASQHFGCFQGNDKNKVCIVQKIYCSSDKWFDHALNNFRKAAQGLLSMYSYRGLGRTTEQSFNAMQVVDRRYKQNNFKTLAWLDDLTGCVIQ